MLSVVIWYYRYYCTVVRTVLSYYYCCGCRLPDVTLQAALRKRTNKPAVAKYEASMLCWRSCTCTYACSTVVVVVSTHWSLHAHLRKPFFFSRQRFLGPVYGENNGKQSCWRRPSFFLFCVWSLIIVWSFNYSNCHCLYCYILCCTTACLCVVWSALDNHTGDCARLLERASPWSSIKTVGRAKSEDPSFQ